jgi:glycosyltransferase involved in cell wall biosynthesis
MQEVLVSVLMTAYNREAFIAEAIESVLLSTFRDFELLIVDDCSIDKTVDIAKKYAVTDSRVKIFENKKNLGQFPNRNHAAALAKGKYIKYLDSDDTITAEGLEEMVKGMEANPQCGIGLEFNNCAPLPPGVTFPFVLDPMNAYLWHFDKGGLLYPGPSNVIYAAKEFKDAGGFDTTIGSNADVYLNLVLAATADAVVFKDKLINWRRHDNQVAAQQDKEASRMMAERLDLHKRMLREKKCPLTKNQQRRIIFSLQVLYLRRASINYLLKGKIAEYVKMLSHKNSALYLPFVGAPLRLIRKLYN